MNLFRASIFLLGISSSPVLSSSIGGQDEARRTPEKNPFAKDISFDEGKKPSGERLIVNGTPAAEGAYPYFVWNRLVVGQLGEGTCGGALIYPDIMVTAAHCMTDDYVVPTPFVGAMRHNITDSGGILRLCSEVIVHEDYDDFFLTNDIALCKLNEPVFIDESEIKLVINTDDMVPADGDSLTVIGVGTTSSGGDLSDVLLEVDLPFVNNEDCNAQPGYGGLVTDDMLCTGLLEEGGAGDCQGDSGGPLVKIEGNVHTLVGLVSWGIGCALANAPNVYASVSYQADWIEENACNVLGGMCDYEAKSSKSAKKEKDGSKPGSMKMKPGKSMKMSKRR